MKLFSRSPSKRRVIIRSGVIGIAFGLSLALAGFALHEAEPPNYYGEYEHTATTVTTHVDVRGNCRIQKFGVAPWRQPDDPKDEAWERNTRVALGVMLIPTAAHDEAIRKLRGPADGFIGIGNLDGAFETTFRDRNGVYTVCHASSTDFKDSDQREWATYHSLTHNGKVYTIGEFLACGNVSRFFPELGQGQGGRNSPNGSRAGKQAVTPNGTASAPLEIPEPGTLLLVLLALGVMIWIISRNRK